MDYNKCVFVGKVASDFKVSGEGDAKRAFFTFKINERRPDGNGQYVDNFMDIPMYAEGRSVDVLTQNVIQGQELLVECKYVSWKDQNGALHHIFKYGWSAFGFKPRDKSSEPQTVPSGPPL